MGAHAPTAFGRRVAALSIAQTACLNSAFLVYMYTHFSTHIHRYFAPAGGNALAGPHIEATRYGRHDRGAAPFPAYPFTLPAHSHPPTQY